jgi:putative component of membrane protein insertase Oxa1/YidC/SpoIIIJ protein YidD
MKFQLLCFLFITIFPFCLYAQSPSSDLSLISSHVQEFDQKNTGSHSVHLQRSHNPVKAVLYLPLYLYQKIFSEQISAQCEFERSCSNFSLAAIQEFGLVKGVCLTADRLTRCNGQSQADSQSYLINHVNGKTIDEPSMYRFKE